jgi:hypothetical protein
MQLDLVLPHWHWLKTVVVSGAPLAALAAVKPKK